MKKIFTIVLALYFVISNLSVCVLAFEDDDSAPKISFSVENGAAVSFFDKISVTIEDDSAVSIVVKVDGEKCDVIDVSKLSVGFHTAYVSAVDNNGNSSAKSIIFNVVDESASVLIGEDDISVSAKGESIVYTGMLLADVHVLENRVGQSDRDYLRCSDEVLISFDDKAEHVTTAVGNSVPYQSFVINTEYSKSASVVVSYTGVTGNGSDIRLTAWNYTESRWDHVATVASGRSSSVSLDVKTYAYRKKIRINAEPVLNYSGDEFIYWNNASSGSIYNINAHTGNHFDLVSAGSHDLVILYIDDVVNEETICWANAVCSAYPNRNVVIYVKDYFTSAYVYGDIADEVWNEIIVSNNNIVAILSNGFDGVFEALRTVDNTERSIVEINTDKSCAYSLRFNNAEQIIITALDVTKYPSNLNDFVYDIDLVDSSRSIQTYEFHAVTDTEALGTVGEESISIDGAQVFYIETHNGEKVDYSKIHVLDEYKNDYNTDEPVEYPQPDAEKYVVTGYSGVSENLRYDVSDSVDESFVTNALDLLPMSPHTVANETTVFEVGKDVDFTEYNRLYFSVTADKYAAWNILIISDDGSINFANDFQVASLFGSPSADYLMGTWSGYIDLSKIISGSHRIKSISLAGATDNKNIIFNYAFIGNSSGSKLRFVTDENTAVAYEGSVGELIELPTEPYKEGYHFDGWYDSIDGGERIESPVTIVDGDIDVYARFSEKATEKREVITYEKEINLERVSIWKIVFVCLCLLFMIIVVCVLRAKIKKTKNGSVN